MRARFVCGPALGRSFLRDLLSMTSTLGAEGELELPV
jgi:hypothetical protein